MSTFYNEHLDAERELGRAEGRIAELARLRPLLKRCFSVVTMKAGGERPLLADLRRELGPRPLDPHDRGPINEAGSVYCEGPLPAQADRGPRFGDRIRAQGALREADRLGLADLADLIDQDAAEARRRELLAFGAAKRNLKRKTLETVDHLTSETGQVEAHELEPAISEIFGSEVTAFSETAETEERFGPRY